MWHKLEGKNPLLPDDGAIVIVKLKCGKYALASYFCDDNGYGFKPCGVSNGSKFAGEIAAWRSFIVNQEK